MDDMRKLAVGHFYNAPFREICAEYLPRIKETFFAWPGVLSCRPAPEFDEATVRRLQDDLRWARANGIELDTLFNANCYGDDAISTNLADFVCSKMDEMGEAGLAPDTVTTTSPFIATVLRRRFPRVKIRMSVNVRVHGTLGLESVEGLFDSFYVSRERHRDLAYLREVSAWARSHGKSVGIQANSGCLRQCPFQQFHDNLHGHGDGRRPQDAAAAREYGFSFFLCKTHYAAPDAREDFLRATWLRPEDMAEYEPLVDVVKLAVRRHPSPGAVVKAYAERSYAGDLAALMDPAHGFDRPFPNAAFSAAGGLWREVRGCPHANDCRHCGKCARLLALVSGK